MGMTRHDALAALAGQLNCRIAEFGEAEFRWRGRNCYSFNRIFLVTAGTGELVTHTGNQRFTLEAGYWYFMPTGLDLEFDFGPQLAFYSLHFQLELLAGCDVFGESRRCSRHRLDEELRRRCREAAAPAGSWRELFRLKALIFELAGELTEHLPEELERHLAVRRRYGVLLDYMARTLSARTRLDELAGVACRSRDRLSREFSRDFGVPLKEFIGRELGRRAEFELLSGCRSIKEIADRLGFANEFYFSRFFRRRTGYSPREFRRLRPGGRSEI